MRINFAAKNFEITPELEKYAHQKLAHVARQIPRVARTTAICEVLFTQKVTATDKMSTCELRLTFGDCVLKAEETTQHPYAALDIGIADVEQQLKTCAIPGAKLGIAKRVKRNLHVL